MMWDLILKGENIVAATVQENNIGIFFKDSSLVEGRNNICGIL
jgi:hypothetical protein